MIYFISIAAYLAIVIGMLIYIRPRHRHNYITPVSTYDDSYDTVHYFLQCSCGECLHVDEEDEVLQHIGKGNFKRIIR